MRIRTPRFAPLFAAAAATAVAGSSALATTMTLDPVHTMIVFRIGHAMASAPFGVFHGITGTIEAPSETGTPTSVTVTAPVAKLDMGNDAWEKHIKSADFFNAAQFPEITFKSTSITGSGDTFEVTGDLTLHGVTKPTTITLHRLGVGKGMQGETRVGYSTEFKVSRRDFGVTKYEGPVGDEVTLMVNLEGVAK